MRIYLNFVSGKSRGFEARGWGLGAGMAVVSRIRIRESLSRWFLDAGSIPQPAIALLCVAFNSKRIKAK